MRAAIVGAACALFLSVTPATHADEGTVEGLAAAERAFSALSVERGMRDAFLAFLADSSILFRPLPVDGRDVWQNRQSVPGTLIWEPSFVEVASSGDLGLSSGPWEYRTSSGAPDSTAYGHFITVWRRDAAGTWRVALDLGVTHDKPERGLGSGVFVSGPNHGPPPATPPDAETLRRELLAMDRALSEEGAARGITRSFQRVAAKDARIYREGALPASRPRQASARFAEGSPSPSFQPWGSGVSRAGDFGYTYGVVERATSATPDSAGYLHVWRRVKAKGWKLTTAVENPVRRPR